MLTKLVLCLSVVIAATLCVSAQANSDRDAIKRTALTYAEAWYEGDGAKMEQALSTELAKRIVRNDQHGFSRIDQMSAMTLVYLTRGGLGKETPKAEQKKDVTILDITGGAATVKLEMRDWVDYMHIARVNGLWVIVNVLWETKPKPDAKRN